MGTSLDYPTFVKRHYEISVADSGEPMGDDDCSPVGHQFLQRLPHGMFVNSVQM